MLGCHFYCLPLLSYSVWSSDLSDISLIARSTELVTVRRHCLKHSTIRSPTDWSTHPLTYHSQLFRLFLLLQENSLASIAENYLSSEWPITRVKFAPKIEGIKCHQQCFINMQPWWSNILSDNRYCRWRGSCEAISSHLTASRCPSPQTWFESWSPIKC